MFNTLNFMAINSCCILGGPYYPTLPYSVSFQTSLVSSEFSQLLISVDVIRTPPYPLFWHVISNRKVLEFDTPPPPLGAHVINGRPPKLKFDAMKISS